MKKNRRNLFVSLLSLALVCVVAIGATLAYFTDKTEVAQNVFTTGKVSIDLIDKSEPEDGQVGGVETENGIAFDKVMPGDDLSKIVGINTVADSSDAYVAIRVSVKDVVLPNAQSVLPDEATAQISDIIKAQVDTSLWDYQDMGNGDVIYYFKSVVPGDVNNLILFSHIPVPGVEWNNEYTDMSFRVDVQAAAIQADNTDLDLLKGMDWDAIEALAD